MTALPCEDQAVVITSVLVIDDHPLYCDALTAAIGKISNAKSVKSAYTMADGLKLAASSTPLDLIFLDLKLPDVTGLSGFFMIKEKLPDVPVLVISAESSDETIHALMTAGATGFIPKDAPQPVFKDALETVSAGMKYLPAGYAPARRAPAAETASMLDASRRIADLTPQQQRIMRLICDGKPNKQIAYELSLAEQTVKAHITALLRRLGVSNRTQAAVLGNSVKLNAAGPQRDPRSLLN